MQCSLLLKFLGLALADTGSTNLPRHDMAQDLTHLVWWAGRIMDDTTCVRIQSFILSFTMYAIQLRQQRVLIPFKIPTRSTHKRA